MVTVLLAYTQVSADCFIRVYRSYNYSSLKPLVHPPLWVKYNAHVNKVYLHVRMQVSSFDNTFHAFYCLMTQSAS